MRDIFKMKIRLKRNLAQWIIEHGKETLREYPYDGITIREVWWMNVKILMIAIDDDICVLEKIKA